MGDTLQRQGIVVTLRELRHLIVDLEQEVKATKEELGVDTSGEAWEFLINIVNKSGASDGWRIEHP